MSDYLSALLIAEIKRFAKKHRLTDIAVSLNYNENELWKPLISNGFLPKDKHTPPSLYLTRIEATLLVDLKPPVDNIFNQLKKIKKKKENQERDQIAC
jgi:hypothetical protein